MSDWYRRATKEDDIAIKERLGGKTVIFESGGKLFRGKVIGSTFTSSMGERYDSPYLKIRTDEGKEFWEFEKDVLLDEGV